MKSLSITNNNKIITYSDGEAKPAHFVVDKVEEIIHFGDTGISLMMGGVHHDIELDSEAARDAAVAAILALY